jgi:diacylglycerol kinase family enzyme
VGLGAAVVARAAKLHVKVDLVDRTYEGPMNNLVVANGQYFGGGMKIAPKAAPTDGLLDIQIEHARKKDAIALMPKVFKGEHLPHPQIFEAKRVRCSVESERPLLVEADGELLGTTPASFEVLRDAINLKV